MKQLSSTADKITFLLFCGILAGFVSACSVVSRDIRRDAAQDLSFASLKRDADQYTGQTVILGGYILETTNLADETRILTLQAPLDFMDEPLSRDRSEGRFLIVHPGFLDPAIYEKNRKITVAGDIRGTQPTRVNGHQYLLPVIGSRQIYLWEKPRETWPYYHDPFYPWPGSFYRYRPYPGYFP